MKLSPEIELFLLQQELIEQLPTLEKIAKTEPLCNLPGDRFRKFVRDLRTYLDLISLSEKVDEFENANR